MSEAKKKVRPFAITEWGPGKTQAQHAEGNSMKDIVSRYKLTGALPQSSLVPQFFDVSKVPTLLEGLNFGAKFNQYFAGLPALTRDEFRNDPLRLMAALQSKDAKMQSRLIELGIRAKAPVKAPPLGTKENPIITAPFVAPEVPKP